MADQSSVLITGAAGTIGRAAARLLSARGHSLILVDRDGGAVTALATELPGAVGREADMLDPRSVAGVFDAVAPSLSAVVLAVGAEGPIGALEDCDDEAFERAMRLNVTSAWLGIKHALRVLKPKGGGSIVALSSISGVMASPMMGAYAAGKHAVMGLVRTAAREAAASGVRVNAVCPGPADSDMMRRIDAQIGRTDAAASVPMKRYAEPDEIAETIAFLVSDASRYSTGGAFMVDGGYSCR